MVGRDKIFIIIVSFNSQKYWPDLLSTLAQESYTDFDLEVIIVDNNSSDDSVAYVREHYPQFILFEQKTNLGFTGANNLAYEYALAQGAKYIYLLNPDTKVSPGFLTPLYNFAKIHPFGSLQSKINLWPQTDHLNSSGNAINFLGFGYCLDWNSLDDKALLIKKIDYASGAGVFLSMAALAKKGGLFAPNLFMYLEDLDLGWSLSLLGFDNYLVPASQIYHKYEFKRSIKQVYWFEHNRLWVYLKNYSLATIILLLPAYLIMELGQLFFAIKNHYLLSKLKAYAWLFSASEWRNLIQARKQIQSARVRSERQVISSFSGKILFQPLDSWALSLANFGFNIYWQIVKFIIFW